MARKLGIQLLKVLSDYKLVVGQVYGEYEAKAHTMGRYLEKIKELTPSFLSFEIVQIFRMENARVDLLSKLATMEYLEIHRRAYVENLERPSIEGEPPS